MTLEDALEDANEMTVEDGVMLVEKKPKGLGYRGFNAARHNSTIHTRNGGGIGKESNAVIKL